MGLLGSIKDFGAELLKNEQLSLGENTPRSLDAPDPDDPTRMVDFGLLGDFASKVDKTAQRSYVESGYIRNVKPRHFEILMQEPDITVVIKKQMFSSLSQNFRTDLMDETDKNFLRASKRLFQNKCQAISVYERLTKLERIIQNKGALDDYFVPLLTQGIETLDQFGMGNIVNSETRSTLDRIQQVKAFSEPELFTSWLVDPSANNDFGVGTGVFELTLVSSLDTTTSVKFGSGTGSLSIEDPYNMMHISNEDVDYAIANIFNPMKPSPFSTDSLEKINNSSIVQLNANRQARGAPPIIIKINDATILYKRVKAFIDETGTELIFSYNPGILGIGSKIEFDPSVFEGPAGINSSDEKLLNTILKNTYLILNTRRQQDRDLDDIENKNNREQIQHIREKMRLYFGNKSIIQVMDEVHVFTSSKTTVDSKTTGIDKTSVTSSSGNLLNLLNSSIGNLEQSFNNTIAFFGGGKDTFIEIEKEAIVGPDFPTWLWASMRNEFTRQAAGVHTFAGVVSGVTSSYSNGKYVLSVSMKDNTWYFNQGRVNINPSVDVQEREIYDPLSPFKTDFDPSSGVELGGTPDLLQENSELLYSGSARFTNGSKFINSSATNFLYGIGDGRKTEDNNSANGSFQKILFDPPGFVYRWKSGIGTYTFGGPKNSLSKEDTSVKLTSNPFAGQDVMNVLSLLITGQPYNYNTFVNASLSAGNLSKDDLFNKPGASSFYRGLLSNLQVDNLVWGNFIPFKRLVVSERGFDFLRSGQFSVQTANSKISSILNQRATFFDALTLASTEFANNPNIHRININGDLVSNPSTITQITPSPDVGPEVKDALINLEQIDQALLIQLAELQKTIATANTNDGTLKIFGDDFSFDPSTTGSITTPEELQEDRRALRSKLNSLTQRRLWKVKANADQNLFIVDDQYDKSYDIQAFERALAGKMNLLKSEYTTPQEQIPMVAEILGLEVFADTQGHIQVKPPGYNKVPSSVFYRMITSKQRLFPKQLEGLFVNQFEGIRDRIEMVEDELRLRAAALGFISDNTAANFFNNGSADATTRYNMSTTFTFVSSNGIIGSKPYAIRSIIQQSDPDKDQDKQSRPLKPLIQAVAGQLKRSGTFGTTAQVASTFDSNLVQPPQSDAVINRYNVIRIRLQSKTDKPIPLIEEMFPASRGQKRTQTDLLKVIREVSKLIAERQSLLKSFANTIKNLDQGLTLNNDPKSAKKALFPNLNRKKGVIPDVIEHMIEDEEVDDLGPGSGGRYIIKENQIISFSKTETPPDFTSVQVNGLYGDGFVQSPTSLNFGDGGNAVVSATAVDYDLWRQYGFKAAPARPTKFISNPEGQAAPLATWMLTEQRKKIIRANCTITGNEYSQPGEVVYVEFLDMLFYVESVKHSFTYAGKFTTTLDLTFGHNPGEYFPTMLDMVGMGLYSKKHNANLIRQVRHGTADGSQHLGVIMVEGFSAAFQDNPAKRLVEGKYGDYNRKVLTNLIVTLQNGNSPGLKVRPIVNIRQYYNSKKGAALDSSLTDVANEILAWLKAPSQKGYSGGSNSSSKSIASSIGGAVTDLFSSQKDSDLSPLPSKLAATLGNIDGIIKITSEDMGGPGKTSPSPQAWQMSRETLSGVPTTPGDPTNPNSLLPSEIALFSSVLDIWVTFENVPTTVETSASPTGANQAAQEDQETVEEALANADVAFNEAIK